jgi:hypothetical protein
MFSKDHAPPHFHVRYAGHRPQINIQTLEVIEGNLSCTALSLVRQWATEHQTETYLELAPMSADAVTEAEKTSALIPPVQFTAPRDVRNVIPLPGYRLAVQFMDDVSGTVDRSALVASPKGGLFFVLYSRAAGEYQRNHPTSAERREPSS